MSSECEVERHSVPRFWVGLRSVAASARVGPVAGEGATVERSAAWAGCRASTERLGGERSRVRTRAGAPGQEQERGLLVATGEGDALASAGVAAAVAKAGVWRVRATPCTGSSCAACTPVAAIGWCRLGHRAPGQGDAEMARRRRGDTSGSRVWRPPQVLVPPSGIGAASAIDFTMCNRGYTRRRPLLCAVQPAGLAYSRDGEHGARRNGISSSARSSDHDEDGDTRAPSKRQNRKSTPVLVARGSMQQAGSESADVSSSSLVSEARLRFAQFAAGAIAGLVNVVVLSPLEVVKVRLQAQSRAISSSAVAMPQRYNGMFHALIVMSREEGWRSFYRGMNASLWAFIPNWAIYWFSYEAMKRRLAQQRNEVKPSPLVHLTAALGAGSLTAVATAPLWTLKSRLQTDIAIGAQRRYSAVLPGLHKIASEEGFFALYKGLTPTLLGLGHVMVQFPVYEHIKLRLANDVEEDIKPKHILIASSLSKVIASAIFYSHEVIRVRIQLDSRVQKNISEPVRMARLARDIMRTEGIRGLYRGFGTNLVRTVPACMLTFTSYELAKRFTTGRTAPQRPAVVSNQEGLRQTSSKQ